MRLLSRNIQPLRIQLWSISHRRWVIGWSIFLASGLATGVCAISQVLGSWQALELAIFNDLTQHRGVVPLDSRLLVVTITEADVAHYGWPLSDQDLALALKKLQVHQPKVIGLDLYRDIPVPPGTQSLYSQVQRDNVVAITNIVDGIPPPPMMAADRIGFNDFTVDPDGVLRRNLLFVTTPEQNYYSFALRLALAYLVDTGVELRYTPQALLLGNRPIPALRSTSGGYQNADDRGYQTLLRYRSGDRVAESISFSQLLEDTVNPTLIHNRVVLIGSTAPSLKDLVETPYSSVQQDAFSRLSGVMIHAHMVSQLLDVAAGEPALFQFWPQSLEYLWIWAWAMVGGILVWWLRHPMAIAIGSGLGLLLIAGWGWVLFTHLIWVPMATPGLGFIGAIALVMGHRLLYTMTRDPLTGLLNPSAFVHRLKQSLNSPLLNSSSPLGVIVLQLNRFQQLRNSLGIQTSDRLLLEIIARWRMILPANAYLGRMGDDEFVVCLPAPLTQQLIQPTNWAEWAEQLQHTLTKPIMVNQQSLVVSASLGIALTQADHLHLPENLLRDGRTAMYRARALGKAHYEVFASGMLKESVEQFTLENDIRRGIAAGEFELYYQPIVDLNTGKIVGFEALVRWRHPSQGFVSPACFIPLAEETGLIIPLGQWIVQSACRQAQQWQAQWPDASLLMSINLSSRQFEQPELVDQISQIISDTGVDPNHLKLEVTESMVMGNIEQTVDVMLKLKALGCKLGMDDFGTGYSSLSYLRRFPIDTLKVDRSFVQAMGQSHEDFEIVRTIITLGHALGMDVIAEGVETETEAAALRSLQCEYAQGYFWAKPLPVDVASDRLHHQFQ